MIVLADNDIAILTTVRNELESIGKELEWFGLSEGITVQAMSKTITELLDSRKVA